ncbi:hypothetical protein F4777DRAFT_583303 [Nemania sp. FL0916]|nr:hypothetical protein F4777DRAFT_583303 [Nemania sp. FL0916]
MSLSQLHSLPLEEQEAILEGPALKPPPGVVVNLENPPNGNTLAITVTTVLLALASIFSLVRVYSRVYCVKHFHFVDYIAFAGFSMYVAYGYILYRLTGVGHFVHQYDIRVKNLAEFLYSIHLGSVFYAVALGTLKPAILIEWERIFSPHRTHPKFYWTCRIMTVVTIVYYISALIAGNLSCFPFEYIWNKTIPGKCFHRKALDVSTAALNFLSHILILLLPQTIIWRLQMTLLRKIGVAIVFAVGLIAVISAGFRLAVTITYLDVADSTYSVSPVALWAFAEMTAIILVFTVPSVPKTFDACRRKLSPMFSSISWTRLSSTKHRQSKWPGSGTGGSDPPTAQGYSTGNESGVALQPLSKAISNHSHQTV